MITEGIKIEGDKAYCEKCGADLGVKGNCTLKIHFDGTKEYGCIYNCKCGAEIRITKERSADPNAFKYSAPKNPKPNAKRVNWITEPEYDPFADKGYTIQLPQCPTCQQYPTYNMEQCPFCGQELDYTE